MIRLKQKRRNWYATLLFWIKYENPYVLELNKQMNYLKRSSLMFPKLLPKIQIHSIIVANLIYVFPYVTTRRECYWLQNQWFSNNHRFFALYEKSCYQQKYSISWIRRFTKKRDSESEFKLLEMWHYSGQIF